MVGEAAIAMHCCSGPKVSYAGPAKFGKRLLGFNGCYGADRSAMPVRTVGAWSTFCGHKVYWRD